MGDSAVAWRPILADLPADVDWLSGEKILRAKQVHAEATVTILVRFDSRITEECRVVDDDGKVIVLVAAIPEGRDRYLTLYGRSRKRGES